MNTLVPDPFSTKLSVKDPRVKVIIATLVVAFCLVAVDAVVLTVRHNSLAVAAAHPAVIQLTAAGFVPATLAVKAGTEIVWRNVDSAPHAVAANPYPTDSSVPGLHSKTVLPGGSYAYTASASGTIHYHDNTQPAVNGTIMVELKGVTLVDQTMVAKQMTTAVRLRRLVTRNVFLDLVLSVWVSFLILPATKVKSAR